MDRSWVNAAKKLEFRDPRGFLMRLRELEPAVAASGLPRAVKGLRTNPLKEWREAREAAIFCVGMSTRIGQTVFLARSESHDYDFIASWVVGDVHHLAPVQLKEVVPAELNSASTLQTAIDALTNKYVDSVDLTVAIYLNQVARFDPQTIDVPGLSVGALWVFGAISPDATEWALWGNFLETPTGNRFEYPA